VADRTSASDQTRRHLTHVELLYRPGERELAAKFLQLLGCETADRGGTWFTAFVEPTGPRDYANNVMYASEVSPDQWLLEQAVAGSCRPARDAYTAMIHGDPQRSPHFGFRVADEAALDALIDRVRQAGEHDPDLAGRVAVHGVYRPGEPDTIAQNMVQVFVWTDIVASGLVTLGQHVEVQWHLPTE
jgi:hypothetical protein